MYSARVAPLGQVASWLETVGDQWDDRLDKLKRTFE
jgi:hypothetical protein